MNPFPLFCGLFLCATIYFMPTGVAVLRGHTDTTPVFVTNLLVGWTVVGWVVMLVWAWNSDPLARMERRRLRELQRRGFIDPR